MNEEYSMSMRWIEEANKKQDTRQEILTFEQYMERFERNPKAESRINCTYLKNMLNYFGRNENGSFKLFEKNFPGSPSVFGQTQAQKELYENLINFEEEGTNNKFLLLVGPNGSSKSSLIKKMMKGAEEYSLSEEGALYTFSWIFPIDQYVKGSLGLNSLMTNTDVTSYALLEDKDISAILPSDLKDHPLLLIPTEYRQEILSEHLKSEGQAKETVARSYLYNGDMSKRNRMIYDALLKSYKGNHRDVLKHIRVERFFISRRYSNSAVTIEPQMHVDASVTQITMDKRLASLPPSLQSLNLFSTQGEAIMANRGIIEFSDLLKRPLDAFKYLLMTMETHTVNIRGILTELDIFFIGSSNEIHLVAFKQHPDFNSFKGRINFIRVPYLLNLIDEEKIYEEQIKNISDKSTFEPNSLKALCLFSVMTRLRPPQEKHYQDKKIGKLASTLSPFEKVALLSKMPLPIRLNNEEKKTLTQGRAEIEEEYYNDNLYEGKFGISPRVVKQIIYDLVHDHKHVTFVEVLEYLDEFIELKNEYDFLNIPPQGEYNNPARFLNTIKSYCLDLLDDQVRDSLGLVDDRSYEDYIEKYVLHIKSQIKNEKIKNTVTGKYLEADEYFIQEFEKHVKIKESADKFRSYMISKLGAYSLDNPGKGIAYVDVFPDIVRALQTSFRDEQKNILKELSNDLVFYIKEVQAKSENKEFKTASLLDENRERIRLVLENLNTKYQYSEYGALTLLQYLFKERY